MNDFWNSITPASNSALKFEYLFWYITGTVTVVSLLVYACLLYFCVRYRRGATTGSTPRILGSHRIELVWTITPLFVFLTFFAGGVYVYDYAVHPPADAMEVFVIGKQWMWKAQYPNGQRVIIGGNPRDMADEDRKDVGKLVIPVNRPTKVTLISEDVIHNFGVPAFRSKIDVLPNRYVSTWYEPTRTGEFHVFCDQYCGTWHSLMVGKIQVVTQPEFDAYLQGYKHYQPSGVVLDGSLAWEGMKLFQKLQCVDCHTNKTNARAPVLEGMYGTERPLRGGGTVVADDAYIAESILNPRAKVREGWEPIMPHYTGQVSPEDLNKLTAYIRSMQPGGTLKKNEQFPAPDGAPQVPSEADKKSENGGKQ